MPQIWLDDAELGTLFGTTAEVARERVLSLGWARRRSRDGTSRAKLPTSVFEDFLLDYAARRLAESVADRSVAELRALLDRAGQTPRSTRRPEAARAA